MKSERKLVGLVLGYNTGQNEMNVLINDVFELV